MNELGELGEVRLIDIEIKDRQRKEYGDIQELVDSIKEHGLICPIAVSVQQEEGRPPYKLEAGGRRFAAHLLMGEEKIKCRIFPRPITELQSKLIELAENVHRLDLNMIEKAQAIKEIDDMMKLEHGVKESTSPDAPGHSQRDTASLMNISPATVTRSLKIAEAHEVFPELKLDECKGPNEALKKIETLQKTLLRERIARSAEAELGSGNEKLFKSYVIGNFFEESKKLPEGIFDLIEVDPPYGISLQEVKKGDYDSNYSDTYNEVEQESYEKFLELLFRECYRLGSRDSWLICWFGPEPWAEPVYRAITKAGYQTRRLTAIWQKNMGQTNMPRYYLSNNTEEFYYARKGDPQIVQQGRSNVFTYPVVHFQQKIHPTERPLSLMMEVLSTFGIAGSKLLVPFAGSGVTLKAGFDLRMLAVGFDLEETYRNAFITKASEEKWE